MSAMTDFLENHLIDFFLRGQALGITGATAGAGSGPATVYVALLTTVDNDAGSAKVEVSGGSYARVPVVSSLANWSGTQGAGTTVVSSGSSGTTSNNVAITFPAPTGNWGSVVGLVIMDAASGGNALLRASLATAKTINNGDPAPYFPPASLSFQLDD